MIVIISGSFTRWTINEVLILVNKVCSPTNVRMTAPSSLFGFFVHALIQLLYENILYIVR